LFLFCLISQGLLSLYVNEVAPTWGQCVPDGCTRRDVVRNYAEVYRGLPVSAHPISCYHRDDQTRRYDAAFYLAT
jgi:hypothetical protein